MFVVDTNVLVYAADRRASEHEACREHLSRWRGAKLPWYLTWGIIYDFLRVVTHPRVFRQPWTTRDAWAFIEALLASPSLSVLTHTSQHAAVAAETLQELEAVRGNLIHDLHTAILMREHGIGRIYTRDTDFHRFPFLEVLDPLSSS